MLYFYNNNDMNYQRITNAFELTSKVCAVMLAAAIVLSTAATTVLFHATLILILLSGNLHHKFNFIIRNPIFWVMLLLFLMFLVGATYSTGPAFDILTILRKYNKFLLATMLLPLFIEEKWRNYAIFSYLLGALAMLISSYLRTYGYLSWGIIGGTVEMFKLSMVFNFLMAFGTYLCLIKMTFTNNKWWRLLWITFFVLLVYTVLFRSIGRSGYFVFVGLMMLFFIQKFRWRGFVIAVTSVILLLGLAFTFSSTFKDRMNTAFNDIKVYHQNNDTSVGLRMAFVQNSIALIKAHPFFGTGTGSYVKEYNDIKQKAPETNVQGVVQHPGDFAHPHNEYIFIMVQFGFMGLAMLLLFFGVPIWYSQFLPEREKYIARGIIVSVLIGSLANCWLYDVTVRYCYAYFIVLAFATLPAGHLFFRQIKN